VAAIRLTDAQRLDWLRLIRTEGIGPRTFRGLVNRFGGAGAALAALPDLARQAGRPLTLPQIGEIEREVEQSRRLGVRFVALGEQDYPTPLAATQTAPPLLAVRGQISVLARPMVALVGSRNASALGMKLTEQLAHDLGQAGIVVVSGLARGIDTAAHRAALAAGTVAVLAGGHGQVYPPQNEPLLDEIVATGAAISELPFTVEPRARDFPRRNRIVAGLSLAVVVVEAARKSGSLITARLAQEEGRELFAVPGSPLDPRAEGANDLIHGQRARLCRSAQDIIDEIAPQIAGEPGQAMLFDGGGAGVPDDDLGLDEWDWLLAEESRPLKMDAGAAASSPQEMPLDMPRHAGDEELPVRLLELIGSTPVSADDLARLGGLPVRVVRAELMDLEMRGLVARDAAGGYCRC
jgi:DNA processing protein